MSRSWRSGCAPMSRARWLLNWRHKCAHVSPSSPLAGRCGLLSVIGRCVLGNLKRDPPSPPLKRFLRALDKMPPRHRPPDVFEEQRFLSLQFKVHKAATGSIFTPRVPSACGCRVFILFACAKIDIAGDVRSELPASRAKTTFHEIYHTNNRTDAQVPLCHV